ncbi:MAG: GGDEF domain-containing protein [Sideroxydans sp.]|nr:GGDEF domain-containing protein [Sideroxydans sp.]
MKVLQSLTLQARLMWIVLGSTAIIGGGTLLLVFAISYQNKLSDSEQHIEQLMNAVEYSAAIASYSSNNEIADDVIKGLMRDEAVCAVQLSSNEGLHLSRSKYAESPSCQISLSHPLLSPFSDTDLIGTLTTRVDNRIIRTRALRYAGQVALGLLALLICPSLVIWLAVSRYITRPIHAYAQQLHTIVPGSATRITTVPHSSIEINRVIADSNVLLINIEAMLLDERAQRSEIQTLKEQYEHLAHHDSLTGLPNRTMFNERLAHMLVQAKRYQLIGALIYLDLDKFKPVNDTLGHDIGDLLLTAVAQRLLKVVRESDTVARLGGDEFVVMLPALHDAAADALAIAEKILHALQQPFELGAHTVQIGSSLGIACYPEHGKDEFTLTKHADLAMYRAKQNGRNNAQLFQADMAAV